MVSQPTVLIVGAGASIPYGYPSGAELVSKIRNRIQNFLRDTTQKSYFQYPRTALEEFANRLYSSRTDSIDAFLGKPNNDRFVELGKLLIAAELVPCENGRGVEPVFDSGDDWYRHLTNRLQANIGAGKICSLTIITFNYDRSLDYHLRSSLQNFFGYSDEQADAEFKNLKVVHVHGQLSKLPWQNKSELDDVRHYGIFDDTYSISKAAMGIKIIHEGKSDDANFVSARESLEAAKRVCFLGFGYNVSNLERLLHGKWYERIGRGVVWGSCFGLVSAEVSVISPYFNGNIKFVNSSFMNREALRHMSFSID